MASTVEQQVGELATQLRLRRVTGSLGAAKRTAALLRILVSSSKQPSAAQLVQEVRAVGSELIKAQPLAFAVGNMVKRVLHLIREEAATELGEGGLGPEAGGEGAGGPAGGAGGRRGGNSPQTGSGLPGLGARGGKILHREISLHTLFDLHEYLESVAAQESQLQQLQEEEAAEKGEAASSGAGEGEYPPGASPPAEERQGARRKKAGAWKGKHSVIEAINELIDELDDVMHNIADLAIEHVYSQEILLTVGSSDAVLAFVQGAAKKRDFQVVVAENAPSYRGRAFARELADQGLSTTLIPDSAVFAMMGRVNKVVIGAHAMLADGGVMAPAGTHMAALAAQRHAVPFVVVIGLHKLTPLFPYDPEVTMNDYRSPQEVVDADVVGESYQGNGAEGGSDLPLRVANPTYDYIPPDLVSLLITDHHGGHNPSYVYRLLAEFYSAEDYRLGLREA